MARRGLDPAANAAAKSLISRPESRVALYVVPTDEELMIARHTLGADGRTERRRRCEITHRMRPRRRGFDEKQTLKSRRGIMEGSRTSQEPKGGTRWRGFKPGAWPTSIDVRDFIVRNVTSV